MMRHFGTTNVCEYTVKMVSHCIILLHVHIYSASSGWQKPQWMFKQLITFHVCLSLFGKNHPLLFLCLCYPYFGTFVFIFHLIGCTYCTFKYHVFAPMGRFQLELIFLYFPLSFHLTVGCFCPVVSNFNTHKTCWKCCYNNKRPTGQKQPTVRWKDGGK